jgi:hypothetical protein
VNRLQQLHALLVQLAHHVLLVQNKLNQLKQRQFKTQLQLK